MFAKKSFWILLMLLSLLGLAAFLYLKPNNPEKESIWQSENVQPFKQWYQINWQKQSVGWASVELIRKDNLVTVIEEDMIEGRVQGERLKFQFKRQLNFSKNKPYNLISGQILSIEPQLTVEQLFINDKTLKVTTKRNHKLATKSLNSVNYNLNDYLSLRRFIELKPNKNDVSIIKELNSDDLGLHYSRYTVLQTPLNENGFYQLEHQLQNSDRKDDTYQSQSSFQYINPLGATFKMERTNGMTFVASDGKISLNPEMQRDLYLGAGITVDKPLGKPSSIALLELSLSKGSMDWFKGHPALTLSNNRLILKSGYKYSEGAPRRRNNSQYHAKSFALAKLHTSGINQTSSKIARLVKFVNQHLNYQTLPANFNLDDILTNKIGDCTEHALLLTEMLNSIGIPARQISGLIYLGDEKQQFGGHVWVEAYYDGYWRGIDPTWNLTSLTATHIPLLIGADKSPQILNKAQKVGLKLEKVNYFASKLTNK